MNTMIPHDQVGCRARDFSKTISQKTGHSKTTTYIRAEMMDIECRHTPQYDVEGDLGGLLQDIPDNIIDHH
jgi:hypothetical protein